MALTDERSVKMHQDRAKTRAAVKALLKAGQAADDGEFLYQLHQLRNTMNGWTLAMRQIARLGHVSEEIQSAFALAVEQHEANEKRLTRKKSTKRSEQKRKSLEAEKSVS
jgi:hypothetical protein